MAKHSLADQIAEVKREIALRENVFPRQVNSGKMKASVADMHPDLMRAVLATLEWLQANEAKIKMLTALGISSGVSALNLGDPER